MSDEPLSVEPVEANGATVGDALAGAAKGFPAWAATPIQARGAALERTADLYEQHRDALIARPAVAPASV